MNRLLALGTGIVLSLVVSGRADAGTITYLVDFHMARDGACNFDGFPRCVPSFSFSFETDGYVTTTGMFTLSTPVTFFTGGGTGTFTHAGTNNKGWWIFGNEHTAITDTSYFPNPLFQDQSNVPLMLLQFRLPFDAPIELRLGLPFYITSPATYQYHEVSGVSTFDPYRWTFGSGLGSSATLRTVEGSVPDDGSSMLLLSAALIGLLSLHGRIGRMKRFGF